MDLAALRREYSQTGLREADVLPDPIAQFIVWFNQAAEANRSSAEANLHEPNAMTLSTCTPDGVPSARIVLLKDVSDAGFTFFTSYQGRKAAELAVNPRAALTLYWAELERQVRIEGTVEKTPDHISDAYFASRPRGSQLGAWASQQSQVVAGREVLEQRLAQQEAHFAGQEVPRPPFWGGYLLRPNVIEFWQGRPNRLHDRIRYRRVESGAWVMERLSP